MSAIVGIDASVLIADVSYANFTGANGPDADELPTWDPVAKTWGWSDPDATTDPSPWTELPERNEISLSISVDVAEHRAFVASLADAWVGKARTWMDWSGSFSGFYDDDPADGDIIFDKMRAGLALYMVMFDSRYVETEGTPSKYWFGRVLLTSVDHTTGSEDFSTLDVDFEGAGKLYRSAVA